MVLEHLFPENWLERKFGYAFLLGVGYSVKRGYKIEANKPTQITFSGILYPGALTIDPGWNFISYFPEEPMTVTEVFGDLLPDGSNVKNQVASSTYYANYGWFPDNFIMEPGIGYMVDNNGNQSVTLQYP